MNNISHRRTARINALLMSLIIAVSLAVPVITVQAAPNEVTQAALGIDVSRYQGQIDWNQVAASGIQFAMIRVGYRTQETGMLNEDLYARYNLQEANRVGIKVGAYFFSTAVTEAEVLEEADFTINLISKYNITFPVAYDCEGYRKTSSRQFTLSNDVRTSLAAKFLDTVAAAGYTPMFYAGRNEITDSRDWNMTVLNNYKIWVAQYPADPFPATSASTYAGVHAMWQYTNGGYIAGISSRVDMNVSYFNYDGIAEAKDTSGAAQISADAAASVQYIPVNEVVTPNVTDLNLRTAPTAEDPSNIVVPINPGDTIVRAGIGNNGWSQVVLNGQILYAYSSYLTKIM
jgi:GH25 family lysozyme M1 (1,4-beta-N-acetylmuramidase)